MCGLSAVRQRSSDARNRMREICTSLAAPAMRRINGLEELWCPGAESNHRHLHFQCSALPTELPGRREAKAAPRRRAVIGAEARVVQNGRGLFHPMAQSLSRAQRALASVI